MVSSVVARLARFARSPFWGFPPQRPKICRRESLTFVVLALACKTKIDHEHSVLRVDKQVSASEVPVDNVQSV